MILDLTNAIMYTVVFLVSAAPQTLNEVEKVLMAEFARRDIDNSGSMCRSEIEIFLKEIGWTDLTVEEMFKHHDKNRDDTITADEFVAWQRAAWEKRSNGKGSDRVLPTDRVLPILQKIFHQHAGPPSIESLAL